MRQHVEDHAYQQGKEASQKESGGGASEDELDELRSERDDLKEKLEEAQQKVEKLKADAGGPEAYSAWAESSREVVAGTIHEKVYLRVGGAIEEAVEIENRARFQRVGDVCFTPEAAAQRYDIRQNESESGSRSRAEEALQDVREQLELFGDPESAERASSSRGRRSPVPDQQTDEAEPIELLGRGIGQQLVSEGAASLTGKRISGAQDLAAVAQGLSPRGRSHPAGKNRRCF